MYIFSKLSESRWEMGNRLSYFIHLDIHYPFLQGLIASSFRLEILGILMWVDKGQMSIRKQDQLETLRIGRPKTASIICERAPPEVGTECGW